MPDIAKYMSGLMDKILDHPAMEITYYHCQQMIPPAPSTFSNTVPEEYRKVVYASPFTMRQKDLNRNIRNMEYIIGKLNPYNLKIRRNNSKRTESEMHLSYTKSQKQENPTEFTYIPKEAKNHAQVIITNASEEEEIYLKKILRYTGIICTSQKKEKYTAYY